MSAAVVNITLNRLIEEFFKVGAAHKMIKTTFYGDFLNIVSSNRVKYCSLLVNTADGTISKSYIEFRVEIAVMDKVFNDQSNLNDVESDTAQILQDLYSVIDYSNRWQSFAKITNASAPIRKFISKGQDVVTGWSMTLNIGVKRRNGICNIPIEDYDYQGNYASYCAGVRIFEDNVLVEVVPSGGRFDFSGAANPINITVNGDIFYADVTTNQEIPVKDSTGANNVGSKVGSEWRISDTQVILKNTANETLSTQNFYAESQSNEMVADNVTSDFNGVTILQETPSGQNKSFSVVDSNEDPIGSVNSDLPNSTQILVSDSVVTIGTQTPADPLTPLRSEQNKTINLVDAIDFDPVQVTVATDTESLAELIIPNGQVIVKDSAGNNLHTKVVKAGGSANQTVSDVTQTVNGVAITNNKAQTSKAITIRYANNDPVTVTTITDTETVFIGEVPDVVTPLNTSNLFKTGQTTSYGANDDGDLERGNGASFLTLSHNNYFGNTNRFTDILGGQTYSDNWIIDWSTWNQITGSFTMWYRVYEVANTWANVMAAQPFTRGAYNDCYLPNRNELTSILNNEANSNTNYAPFNINVVAANNLLWTSTTCINNTAAAFVFLGNTGNNGLSGASKTASQRYILMRIGNISEL